MFDVGVPYSSFQEAYDKGFQGGVLTTLDELVRAHELPSSVAHWVVAVREKAKASGV